MSLGEAELIGHTKAGEIPETPDGLALAIIQLALQKERENANGNNSRPD